MRGDAKSTVRPHLRFITKKQFEIIHDATLKILAGTGVIVNLPEVVEMLAGHGCRVARDNVVRIPGHLVQEAVESTPGGFTLSDRNGEECIMLKGKRSYWGTGSDTPYILDSFTDQRRKTSLEDIEKAAVLVDGLENLDFMMSMGLAHELPQDVADKYHFLTMVSHTVKPIVFTASSVDNLRDIYEMACLVSGGEENLRSRPSIVHYTEPIAPLIHPADSLGKLIFCLDMGIPVIYTSATTSGQNGPATLAADIALSNARILSGVVIGQLRKKGSRMVVTMHASSMDFSSAVHTYASPEHMICQAVARDLAQYYRIPTWGRAGATDSKIVDQQAAFESGQEILLQALCGENLIHDVGYIESGLTASWDAMVLADEFIAVAKRVVRGFELDEDTLALDLIDRIGPSGNYLSQMHTVENFKKETFIPKMIDRDIFRNWQDKGGRSLLDKAKLRVKDILKNHKPEPLDGRLLRELEKIAQRRSKTDPEK